MQNLAGNPDADHEVEKELTRSRINVVRHDEPLEGEVPTRLSGTLNKHGRPIFRFHRAWYYWEVDGLVPLNVAQELYADPVGRYDIRAGGHCGSPPPEEWEYGGVVLTYHIDSEVGLRVFVDTLRANNLID